MKAGTLLIGLVATFLVVYALLAVHTQQALGGAYQGWAAVQSIATTTITGNQSVDELFAAQKSCTGRTITTNGTAIRFITGDPGNGDVSSTTLLASNIGLIQGVSTTVMYDSGTYGCGRWFAVAAASTTITVTEYQ